jgi:hypothetical protein
MAANPTPRPALDVLDEVRARVAAFPKIRVHLNPDAVLWIGVGLNNTGCGPFVELVPDPDCQMGRMFIEEGR